MIKDSALIKETKEWLNTAAFQVENTENSDLITFVFQDDMYAELNLKLSKFIYHCPDLGGKVNYGIHPNFKRVANYTDQINIYTFSKTEWESGEFFLENRAVENVLFSNFEIEITIPSKVTIEEKYFIYNQYRGFLHRLPFCFASEMYDQEFRGILNSFELTNADISVLDRYENIFLNADKDFDIVFKNNSHYKKVDWV